MLFSQTFSINFVAHSKRVCRWKKNAPTTATATATPTYPQRREIKKSFAVHDNV